MSDEIEALKNSDKNIRDLIRENKTKTTKDKEEPYRILNVIEPSGNEKIFNDTNFNPSPNITRTREFFMRKTESNFIKTSLSPIKSTKNIPFNKKNLINLSTPGILKTDIMQIDHLIKKHSHILTHFKQNTSNRFLNHLSALGFANSNINPNSSSVFSKKCLDLEKNNSIQISTFFDKIIENSQNLDYLLKDFNCKTKEELICRLAFEIYFEQLFINKTNDLLFLINLKFHNQNNQMAITYSDTHSKSSQIKFLLDNITEKSNKNIYENLYDNQVNTISSMELIKHENKDAHEVHIPTENDDDLPLDKILNFNTMSDLIKFPTQNEVIKHIQFLFSQFNDKAFNIFSSFVTEIAKSDQSVLYKLRKTEDLIENFILIRKLIGDLYKSEENENKILKEKINSNEIENKSQIDSLNEKLNFIENENKKLLLENKKNKNRDINLILSKIEEENQSLFRRLKDFENLEIEKLNEDNKKMQIKLDEVTMSKNILNEEKSLLEKQIFVLKGNLHVNRKVNYNNKNSNLKKIEDPNESYEILLQEQFQDMKNAFINKLNVINTEYKNLKKASGKEIDKLKSKLNTFKNIKDVFTAQIMDVRKTFDNFNF